MRQKARAERRGTSADRRRPKKFRDAVADESRADEQSGARIALRKTPIERASGVLPQPARSPSGGRGTPEHGIAASPGPRRASELGNVDRRDRRQARMRCVAYRRSPGDLPERLARRRIQGRRISDLRSLNWRPYQVSDIGRTPRCRHWTSPRTRTTESYPKALVRSGSWLDARTPPTIDFARSTWPVEPQRHRGAFSDRDGVKPSEAAHCESVRQVPADLSQRLARREPQPSLEFARTTWRASRQQHWPWSSAIIAVKRPERALESYRARPSRRSTSGWLRTPTLHGDRNISQPNLGDQPLQHRCNRPGATYGSAGTRRWTSYRARPWPIWEQTGSTRTRPSPIFPEQPGGHAIGNNGNLLQADIGESGTWRSESLRARL